MLLGVTLLTSLDEPDLARIGLTGPLGDRVQALAAMAQVAGLDGVVAPAREVQSLRKSLGKKMAFVVPGIRTVAPGHSSTSPRRDDQAQIATPGNAIRWGADYLVVGRPITAAPDPVAAMDSILHDMQFALTYRQ